MRGHDDYSFEQFVENRRAEREEMYGKEYFAHIMDAKFEMSIEVNYPEDESSADDYRLK
jgi:hypothetical protein